MIQDNQDTVSARLADIPALTRRSLHQWYVPAFAVLILALGAFIHLQLRVSEYDVSMVVAAVTPPGGESKPSIDVGSAASLLGIRAGSSGNAYLDQYQELLTSVELARNIDSNGPLFHEMFSGEWDEESKNWHPPRGNVADIKRFISNALGAPPWHQPDAARFAEEMGNDLIFAPVGRTEMMRITVRTKDPDFTVKLLNVVNKTADDILRRNGLRRVAGYLDYLNQEVPKVHNNENQKALGDLILEQQRQLMALNASTVTFATQLIEAPSIPYLPVGMRPLPLMALSVLLGLALGGMIFVLFSEAQIERFFARIPLLGLLVR